MKELREWANFIFTSIAAAAIVYLNLRFDNQRLEIESGAAKTYETQDAHAADMRTLTEWTKNIQQGQTDQKLAIQHLTDVLASRRGDGVPRNQNTQN